MKPITSQFSLIVAGAILSAAAALLSTTRLEYCGQPEALRPRIEHVAAVETRRPTPAPPQKVVFVRVETDKPDLEVGWVEN